MDIAEVMDWLIRGQYKHVCVACGCGCGNSIMEEISRLPETVCRIGKPGPFTDGVVRVEGCRKPTVDDSQEAFWVEQMMKK